ncbi:MAG: LacI family DNA-binding transcriptional regulator [Pseudomonadota bacterium]
MTHRFPIKEIALQSGLGTATVDRVLNNRAHVSAQTQSRVEAAINELELQEQQLAARGRRMFVDFVAEAPRRFTDEIRAAANRALSAISYGVFRPRFLFQETMSDADLAVIFDRIEKRGSHGVCLKARDNAFVSTKIDRLRQIGVPVVTLVTDIPSSKRNAYVGIDNANAGRAAADLIFKLLRNRRGVVFATRSRQDFLGESERFLWFQKTLARLAPNLAIVDVTGGAGLAQSTAVLFEHQVAQHGTPLAVYSMGGGNSAILDAFPPKSLAELVFIAHDLDAENRMLLRQNKITFVLQHDLEIDIKNAFRAMAASHGLASPMPSEIMSTVQIVGPHNMSA